MKKPELKKYLDVKPDDEDKAFVETHFCPICGKKAVTYYLTKDEDEYDIVEIDNVAWWWVDDDSQFNIEFCHSEDGLICDEDEIIYFSFDELGIKKPKEIFKPLFDEYEKNFNCKDRKPYFCSKGCVKKYILSKLNTSL